MSPYVPTKAELRSRKQRIEKDRKNHKNKNSWLEHYTVFGAY